MKLTDEQKEILVAIAEGAEYQIKLLVQGNWQDSPWLNPPLFQVVAEMQQNRIRLKPTPVLVPLEQSDWVDGPWWVKYGRSTPKMIIGMMDHGVETKHVPIRFDELFADSNYMRSRTCRPDDWHLCRKQKGGV